MKIVSKFKDYYDSMRVQDLDKEPFYLRETKVFPLPAMNDAQRFQADRMVSASTVPPRPISDVERAETKGFDKKTSFRNQKNRTKSERGDW